jgi:hypothetical protein
MGKQEKRDGLDGRIAPPLDVTGGSRPQPKTVTPALADPAGALCRPTLRPVGAVSESTGEPNPTIGHT